MHSGQHYDPELADLFFDELDIPAPDHALAIGRGTPNAQLALILERLDPLLVGSGRTCPGLTVIRPRRIGGAAAKRDIPVAHVEAGLRSFVRSMPEEQNRVATDHLSEAAVVTDLAREGITAGVHNVGDVMYDADIAVCAGCSAPRPPGVRPGAGRLRSRHRAPRRGHRHAPGARRPRRRARCHRRTRRVPVHPRTRHKLEHGRDPTCTSRRRWAIWTSPRCSWPRA